VYEIAAANGWLDLLKWARLNYLPNGIELDEQNVCSLAAYYDHLDIIKWMHSNGYKISKCMYVFCWWLQFRNIKMDPTKLLYMWWNISYIFVFDI
jgi:hypothetical protein